MKVIFLDRDGTINEEVNYLHRPEDLRLIQGVPEALAKLKQAGYHLIVVTNQAGIARGYYTEEDCRALHRYMNEQLAAYGAEIDAFYYCPHHPEHGIGSYLCSCSCRKPGTGMFEQAECDIQAGKLPLNAYDKDGFCLDRAASFMVGDKLLDTEAGRNFGLRSILLGSGYGKEEYSKSTGTEFDRYFDTMEEGVRWILEQSGNLTR